MKYLVLKGKRNILSCKLSGTVLLAIITGLNFSSCSANREATAGVEAIVIQNAKKKQPTCECLPYIDKYKWKRQTVYALGFDGPACSWMPSFFDAKGNEFALPNKITPQEFYLQSTPVKRIWNCSKP